MIRFLEATIREHWDSWRLGPAPATLAFQKAKGQQAVFLVYTESEPSPVIVAKVSRAPDQNPLVEREYHALQHFSGSLVPPAKDALPRPLFSGHFEDGFVMLQSGLKGRIVSQWVRRSFGVPGARRRLERRVERLHHWLSSFQKQTRGGELPITETMLEQRYLTRLRRFREAYDPSGDEARRIDALESGLRDLLGLRLPLVGMHGDLYIENCLFDGTDVGVFDWSFSEEAALPIWDPMLFASTLYVWDGHRGTCPTLGLFADHWIRPILSRFVYDVTDHWKIDPEAVSTLFGLFLVRMATRDSAEVGAHARRNALWRRKFYEFVRLGSTLERV